MIPHRVIKVFDAASVGVQCRNAAMIRHHDRYLLACMDHRSGQGEIFVVRLNTKFDAIGLPKKLDLKIGGMNILGCEDARLFYHRGELYVTYFLWLGGRNECGNMTSIAYARINSETLEVEEKMLPQINPRNKWEKNHAYFSQHIVSQRDKLHVIYSLEPTRRVFSLDGVFTGALYESKLPAWSHGDRRGGTSPVLIGDRYYHFFHGFKPIDDHRRYSIGACVFDCQPPFAVKRITPESLIAVDYGPGRYSKLEHAFSATLVGNEWMLTIEQPEPYHTQLWAFDRDQVESELKDV